jgi:[ribosomal protein S18]-alanine N-acetyltransferase
VTAVLRPLRWWDLERIVPLERALFHGNPWSAETFWSELALVHSRHYLLAEDAGEPVGYAGLAVTGAQGEVQTIAVASSYQGRGLGGRLLDALLAEADRRDCASVLLEVRVGNEPARALYLGRGFEAIGMRRGYYEPDGMDAVVMRRRRGGS